MFERYSEKARRAIFFARYEASQFGAASIQAHHLLLGVLRECPPALNLPREKIREECEKAFPPGEKIHTSVDLPLEEEAKHILEVAAAEAERLRHAAIEPDHLLLAMLRLKNSFTAKTLRKFGFGQKMLEESIPVTDELAVFPDMATPGARLRKLVLAAPGTLMRFSESSAAQAIGRNGWSRKQALGHLFDCAATHHHWFAIALTDKNPALARLPESAWVAAMHYEEIPWDALVDAWTAINALIAHVLTVALPAKSNVLCRVGVKDRVPLSALAEDYVAYCEDWLAAILKLGSPSAGDRGAQSADPSR